MKVLVVAAHPDDEILGVGATMAKHAMKGDQVHIVIIGDGITARYDVEDLGKAEVKKQTEVIRGHAVKASKVVGAKSIDTYGYPCCRFDGVGILEITKIVEKHIREVQPEMIYTHHHGDVNVDHRLVFDAMMPAIRPVSGFSVREIRCFESASSSEWIPPVGARTFTPNVYVDVKESFDKKIEALKCYQSEIRDFPHPRSPEALTAYAKTRGAAAGLTMAEAFELIRHVDR